MRPELFTRVLDFDEALARVLASASPIDETEMVDLSSADGRVAAADIAAPADVPAFARAAMDGYAVRTDDLAVAPGTTVDLLCTSIAFTGTVPGEPVAPGTCTAIATGAPVPPGADAVVMVEATALIETTGACESPSPVGRHVRFSTRPATGQHISPRGADMHTGEVVARRGDVLSPARVGSLAAIGLALVEVFRKPTVAILSTGNEVTSPGGPLPPGHVYDVNRFTVEAVVRRHGGRPLPLAPVADSIAALRTALDSSMAYDAVVLSGGSSVGDRDLVIDAISGRGEVIFHGIAVKPGKPTLLARIGRTIVFGMPGNPASCLSNAYMLLVPFLRKMARLPAWHPFTLTAPLARRVASTPERHQFYPVRVANGMVHPAFKSSGDITSMAGADGYIEIPIGVTACDAGTLVTVRLF